MMEFNPASTQTVNYTALDAESPGLHPSASAQPSVVVADNDPEVRKWLAKLLASWGYAVTTAHDGPEALAVLQQSGGPSLAVLAWSMPGMGGPEVCRRIRQADYFRYIYIVLLSEPEERKDAIEGLNSGADDCLKKTCDPDELRARLKAGERVCGQKAMSESEDRFHAAFELAGAGMVIAGAGGRYLQVNQAFCDFLGFEKEELLSKTVFDVSPAEDVPVLQEEFERFFNGCDEVKRVERRYIHRNGAILWALLTVAGLRTGVSVVAQTQDITGTKNAEDRLRRSEALFRAIAENAGDLILAMQPDGMILYASPAYEVLLGHRIEELRGAVLFEVLLHPDDRPLARQEIEMAIQLGNTASSRFRLLHKDGSIRWVESHAGIVRTPQGQVEQIVVTSRIIDDQLATEQVLEEREEQLKLMLDSTAEAIYCIDMDGNCTFRNRAFLRLMRYENIDQILGHNVHMLIHHHHADGTPYPKNDCRIVKGLRNCQETHVDDEVLWRADGSCFPAEYWSYPVWKNGEIDGCVVTFVDITERRRAEEALRNAHDESELFINSVPSILIGLNANRRITRWNLAAADTFGLNKENVHGLPLAQCGIRWVNREIEAEIDSWQHISNSRRCDNLSFEKEGETRMLALTLTRVSFSAEEAIGLLITGIDVTDRRNLESQLLQAQKLEAIGQLAAGIAHEINTPIQFVSDNTTFIKESWSAAEALLSASVRLRAESERDAGSDSARGNFDKLWEEADISYLQEEVPRAIDQALEGLRRVAGIVRAMKEFSHPGSEEKLLIDINRAIGTTITVAGNEWKYVADMQTDFDPGLPMVLCLANEFNQAMLNVIINAAHAIADSVRLTPDLKGVIHISTRHDGDEVEIRIQDNGGGIPEKIRGRVFEPFFTTKEVGKGTGQGLTQAHTLIVKKHGGQLWFESETGKGTTFFIRLPLNGECRKAQPGQTHL